MTVMSLGESEEHAPVVDQPFERVVEEAVAAVAAVEVCVVEVEVLVVVEMTVLALAVEVTAGAVKTIMA